MKNTEKSDLAIPVKPRDAKINKIVTSHVKPNGNGKKPINTVNNEINTKNGFSSSKVDTSLYKYNNTDSEFYNSLSFGQYLSASNFIAIDIDTDKIRYVTGKSGTKNIHIKEWGVQVTPPGEKDRNKAIKLTLDNIKANIHKAGYKVHVCFFSPDISIRQIILPKMRKISELESAIYYKLQSDLPGFNEQSQWRYKILEEIVDSDSINVRIVVLIVPADVISKYLELLSETGLTPDTLIPRSIASSQAFRKIVPQTSGDVLVDISYDSTHINFVSGGTLEYSRNIASGASNLETAVHDKKSKLLGPDSDKIELEDGISKNGATRPEMIRKSLKMRLKVLHSSQNPVLQLFKNELQNSLDYYNSINKNNPVKRIFLTGYGIQKESLSSFLRNTMKNPVFVLSPKLDPSVKNTLEFGEYFTTIGAVIAGKTPFNLIPKEFRSHILFKRLNILVIVLTIMTMVTMGYLTNIISDQVSNLENELILIEKKYNQLNPIEVEYQNSNSQINAILKAQKRLKASVGKNSKALEVMRLISNETPEQVILTELSFTQGTVFKNKKNQKKSKGRKSKQQTSGNLVLISGTVTGDYLMGDVILVNYVDHLKNVGYFKNLIISDKIKKNDKRSMTFELKAQF